MLSPIEIVWRDKLLKVDLEVLALFQQPRSTWNLHKDANKSYSYCYYAIQNFIELKLIHKVREKPSQKNPKIIVKEYALTPKGAQLLQMFGK